MTNGGDLMVGEKFASNMLPPTAHSQTVEPRSLFNAYLAACSENNAVAIERVAAQLESSVDQNTPLDNLDLSSLSIQSMRDMKPLCALILSNPYLLKVDLSNLELPKLDCWFDIAKAIAQNGTVRNIVLDNSTQLNAKSVLKFFDILERDYEKIGQTLQSVHLVGLSLHASKSLSRKLRTVPIFSLHIDNAQFDLSTYLEKLDASQFELKTDSSGAIQNSRAPISLLSKISAAKNDFSHADASPISKLLSLSTCLVSLDLRDNYIADSGAVLLAQGLLQNSGLAYLSLWNNRVGRDGLTAILENTMTHPTLTTLELGCNDCSWDTDGEVVKRYLCTNRKIGFLGLACCKIHDAVQSISVAEGVADCRSLWGIDLRENSLGGIAGFMALFKAVEVAMNDADLEKRVRLEQCALTYQEGTEEEEWVRKIEERVMSATSPRSADGDAAEGQVNQEETHRRTSLQRVAPAGSASNESPVSHSDSSESVESEESFESAENLEEANDRAEIDVQGGAVVENASHAPVVAHESLGDAAPIATSQAPVSAVQQPAVAQSTAAVAPADEDQMSVGDELSAEEVPTSNLDMSFEESRAQQFHVDEEAAAESISPNKADEEEQEVVEQKQDVPVVPEFQLETDPVAGHVDTNSEDSGQQISVPADDLPASAPVHDAHDRSVAAADFVAAAQVSENNAEPMHATDTPEEAVPALEGIAKMDETVQDEANTNPAEDQFPAAEAARESLPQEPESQHSSLEQPTTIEEQSVNAAAEHESQSAANTNDPFGDVSVPSAEFGSSNTEASTDATDPFGFEIPPPQLRSENAFNDAFDPAPASTAAAATADSSASIDDMFAGLSTQSVTSSSNPFEEDPSKNEFSEKDNAASPASSLSAGEQSLPEADLFDFGDSRVHSAPPAATEHDVSASEVKPAEGDLFDFLQ
eukprot:ANDGO_00976.mRNA.1 Protein phosphatase 1 regulatory subunit 37 homolog